MIELTGISLFPRTPATLGGEVILSDFSLHVEKGEFVILLGDSGSGKSTLMNMLTGGSGPFTGTARVSKFNISALRGSALVSYRRSVGIVTADAPLLEDRSVAENIALPLEIIGQRRKTIDEAVGNVVLRFGLSEIANRNPETLSASERQVALIARAVVAEPLVLLIDEPTAHLDRAGTERIIALLQREHLRGMTILLATQNLAIPLLVPEARIAAISRHMQETAG